MSPWMAWALSELFWIVEGIERKPKRKRVGLCAKKEILSLCV